MELFLLYAWLKLDGVHFILAGATVVLMLGTVFAGIGYLINDGDYNFEKRARDGCRNAIRRMWVPLVVVIVTQLVLPTSKQTAYLVGGHFALKAASTPEAEKVMAILRKKANEYMDEQLKPATK